VAQLARAVENDYVGAPVGFMDPAVVMHAEADHALLVDCSDESTTRVPLALHDAGMELLVVDTGEGHQTSGSIYAERVAQCSSAAEELGVASLRQVSDVHQLAGLDDVVRRRAWHVVTENARVLLMVEALIRGDWAAVGDLMVQSHDSLRDDYAVSTPALDLVVDEAMRVGALGARLTGAGLGGSAVVLTPAERRDGVERSLLQSADEAGLGPLRVLRVEAGGPAHRVHV
jgi:galactokinase